MTITDEMIKPFDFNFCSIDPSLPALKAIGNFYTFVFVSYYFFVNVFCFIDLPGILYEIPDPERVGTSFKRVVEFRDSLKNVVGPNF